MRNANPLDIPPAGRYDMVALKVGPNGKKQWTCIAMIDNGPHKGKRVSGQTPRSIIVGHRFSAYLTVTYIAKDSEEEVDSTYDQSNVIVRYSLKDIDLQPERPAQLKPRDQHARFVRAPRT